MGFRVTISASRSVQKKGTFRGLARILKNAQGRVSVVNSKGKEVAFGNADQIYTEYKLAKDSYNYLGEKNCSWFDGPMGY